MNKKSKAAKSKATKKKSVAKFSSAKALAVASNSQKSTAERVTAMALAPSVLYETENDIQSILNILQDRSEAIALRLAALQALQSASFSVVDFESIRGEYIATLRKVAVDPDPELRQRVLGILAREKDGFAQKKLLEGLQKPEKALLPPEKALQLLGYDVHTEAYSIAREIVKAPPNPTAKREALRLLAADAKSAPMFEKLLKDKSESDEIRQLSASALHAINPAKMQASARELLLDPQEKGNIQATCLTVITSFGDRDAVAKDKLLLDRVEKIKATAAPKIKQCARQLLDKYGR